MRVAGVALCALLCGCAAGNFSVRTLPAETPAADTLAQLQAAEALHAEASAAAVRARAAAAEGLGPPLTAAEVPSLATYDPWERVNRAIYRFNARFDETLFLPVADQYRRLPGVVRGGVHNFFSNLAEVVSVLNFSAQLRPGPGVRSLGRFVLNSTLGIGGLFDVATRAHIPVNHTGFGQTLARWGVHQGPYFVMPLLGPSSVRDGFGWCVDFGTNYVINLGQLYQGTAGWVLTPLNAIDIRATTSFRYYSTGSPFEYDTVRFLYVRAKLIEDDQLRMWHRSGRRDPSAPAGQ